MRYLSLALIILVAVGRAVAVDSPYAAAPTSARVRCIVTFAEQADLSPREPGVLKENPIAVGEHVKAGQLVLQLDDMKAQQERNVAQAKFDAAKIKADDDVNIRYSKSAHDYAIKDLEYNNKANRNVPGTVPQAKIDELTLKETETKLAIEKATHDHLVAVSEAGIEAAEVKSAETMIDLLKVYSPIDGEVVEVRKHKGEAVQPGEPGVIRVVGLDKLWVEGQVSAADFTREQLENQPVTVEVTIGPIGHRQKKTVPGRITCVSPLTESGGNYLVRAEVQREKRELPMTLNTGDQAEMVIPVRSADAH